MVSLGSPTLEFRYLDPQTCMSVSYESPNLHFNTPMALMGYADCVLTHELENLDDTIVQV
jgi:hypothetical protein